MFMLNNGSDGESKCLSKSFVTICLHLVVVLVS
jgi:hypothetical protein